MKSVLLKIALWPGLLLVGIVVTEIFGPTAGGFFGLVGGVLVAGYFIGAAIHEDALDDRPYTRTPDSESDRDRDAGV